MPLAFRKIDVLPTEEPGIDGPRARPDHRQNGAKDRLYDGNPWIAGMREKRRARDRHFSDSCQRSRHRGPQTDQEKYPRADSNDLQGDYRQRRRSEYPNHSKTN
jgi:hypothetical protein